MPRLKRRRLKYVPDGMGVSGYNISGSDAVNARWNGLLAGWHLDETSDGTVQVNRADVLGVNTLTDNNTTPSTDGIINNGARFTTANLEFLNVADPFSFTAAATWSWWQRQQTVTGDQAKLTKWQHGTSTDWAIQVDGTAGSIRLYTAIAASDTGNTSCRSTTVVTLNSWQHIVITYDGSGTDPADKVKMYINGSPDTVIFDAGTIPASLQNGTSPFRIGAFSGTLTRYDDGDTDEVYVFNQAKNAAWVSGMYNAGAGRAYPD